MIDRKNSYSSSYSSNSESEYTLCNNRFCENDSDEMLTPITDLSQNLHLLADTSTTTNTVIRKGKNKITENEKARKKYKKSWFTYIGSTVNVTLRCLGRLLQLPIRIAFGNKKNKMIKDTIVKKIDSNNINKSRPSSTEKRISKRKRIATEVWLNAERRIKPKSKSSSRRSQREARSDCSKLPNTAEKVSSLGIGPRVLIKNKDRLKTPIKKSHNRLEKMVMCSVSSVLALALSVTTSLFCGGFHCRDNPEKLLCSSVFSFLFVLTFPMFFMLFYKELERKYRSAQA